MLLIKNFLKECYFRKKYISFSKQGIWIYVGHSFLWSTGKLIILLSILS